MAFQVSHDLREHAETFEHWRTYRGGRASFIYLLTEWENEQPTGFCKIGTAGDPVARVRSLATGNPRHLQINGLFAGGLDVERAMHRRWRGYRVRDTEWFGNGCLEGLWISFRTIDAEQRALDPMSSMRELALVAERINGMDLIGGGEYVDPRVCVDSYSCPCAECVAVRDQKVKRGIRPRRPLPVKRAA